MADDCGGCGGGTDGAVFLTERLLAGRTGSSFTVLLARTFNGSDTG